MRPIGTGSGDRRHRRRVACPAIGLVTALALSAPASARPDLPALDPATGALKAPRVPDSHRIGVALMAPRYKPGGKLGPNILVEGAEDAAGLGFRTIKVGLSSEVLSPDWQYYSLPEETLATVRSIVDLARLDVYKRLFDLPFQTYFLAADAIGEGNWEALRARAEPGEPRPADRPLSQSAKDQIYRQLHDLALHLLRTYGGTNKVFILQNHEADWHTLPSADAKLDPSDIALRNTLDYFRLRQKAVDDARREVGATGVYVYHMAEVNLVVKAMAGGKTVTNDVLPAVACDLVGYSSWDSSSAGDGQFLKALAHLKSKAKDSFAFGDDNVVISELGVAERSRPDIAPEVRTLYEALTARCPWVVHWALYDNDATRVQDGEKVTALDAREGECVGYWVRKPDGRLGRFFRAYQPYLSPDLDDPDPIDAPRYVDRAYRLVLGRRPDPGGRARAIGLVESRPWEKELLIKDLMFTPEYRDRTGGSAASFVYDTYRLILGRRPEPSLASHFGRDFRSDADRAAYLDALLKSEEARRRYVTWLYRRYLDRDPEPQGLQTWMTLLRRGQTRRQVLDQFLAALPPN